MLVVVHVDDLRGTPEQQQKHLAPILKGEEVWCQLFSEPGSGSDLASLGTRAVRDGDDWIVNGQKVWTSLGQYADYAILLARTDADQPKHAGITYFILDMKSPGIEVRPITQITGVQHFNETFLTDVRIPNANVVGGANEGWKVAQTTLANERNFIGSGQFGSSRMGEFSARAVRDSNESILNQQAASLLQNQGQRLQAAQQMGALSQAEQQMMLRDAAALESSGQQQQLQNQRNLDYGRQQFMEEREFPRANAQFMNQILHGFNPPTATTATNTGPYSGAMSPSGLQTMLGTGMLASQLFKRRGGRVNYNRGGRVARPIPALQYLR
jgi:alkylation response protein AidB-like acyl-CoA dehydrogenase